ncbi:MAG: hypothetical protein OHK0031_19320 [Anaerolineales bacterium]
MSRILILLLILLSACNLPAQPAAAPTVDSAAVATIAAATLSAIRAQTPLATPTQPPAATATPSPSATFSAPLITLSENANCRSGPGEAYSVVILLKKGEQPAPIGRSPGFWIVRSAKGDCWLAQQLASASGSLESLPTAVLPPTPTPNLPAAPTGLRYNITCAYGGGATVTLTWQDAASGEDGYRVYRDGALLGQLAANTTEYSDTVPGSSGVFIYRVEAFNATGGAPAQVTVTLTCG